LRNPIRESDIVLKTYYFNSPITIKSNGREGKKGSNVNLDGKILHNVIGHFDGVGMQSRHGTQVALNKTKGW
jgi:hypothetical protein